MDDENGIAIEALKQMRSVLRAAMAKMPEIEAEEEGEAPEMEAAEATIDEPPMEETIEEEAAPMAGKMTVLETITPKLASPPQMPPKRGPGRPKGSGRY